MKITILIPAYNEEKRILNTLKQIKEYVRNRDEDFEIIVIDDGSIDRTEEIVKRFDTKIILLKNKKNQGKGYSLKRGMLASRGDVTLFMDADSSTKIIELDKFFPYINSYDILIGSRAISHSSILIPQGFIRRNIGSLAHKLIQLVLKIKVHDTMCGFKMYNKKSRQFLFKKQINKGWGFDYEILFLAKKFNFRIKEVPVVWRNDSRSKVTIKGYLKSLEELFLIKINDFFKKYG